MISNVNTLSTLRTLAGFHGAYGWRKKVAPYVNDKNWKVSRAASLLLSDHTKNSRNKMIQLLPKIELHYHLDGSVKRETIFDLSKTQKIDLSKTSGRLPAGYTVEDIRKIVSMQPGEKLDPSKFMEFLTDKFLLPLVVMQTPEALERIAYEAMEDAYLDGIFHREVIFAPCLHTGQGLSYGEVTDAIVAGLLKGEKEFGVTSSLRPSIYRDKVAVKGFEDHPLKTVDAILRAREKYGDQIEIALDLVGFEAPFPPEDQRYQLAIMKAAKNGVPLSLHAGEMPGTRDNVFTAVTAFEAKRVGHGIYAIFGGVSPWELAALKNVVFEVCPTSNVLLGNTGEMKSHPIARMDQMGLKVTVNTDDATVFNITLSEEFKKLEESRLKIFPLRSDIYKKLQENALEGAFMGLAKKENLRRKISEYYEIMDKIAKITGVY
ncbi:MAG: hypothetical protein ABH860_02685 [bacterium]